MTANTFSFAQRLKSLRVNKHLSKTALAGLVGVSITCVWNWEEGNTEPRPANMDSLSHALDVPVTYLQSGEGLEEDLEDGHAGSGTILAQVIADAKVQIAALAGIEPKKVNISLNY